MVDRKDLLTRVFFGRLYSKSLLVTGAGFFIIFIYQVFISNSDGLYVLLINFKLPCLLSQGRFNLNDLSLCIRLPGL
jgi:hypothetical protein